MIAMNAAKPVTNPKDGYAGNGASVFSRCNAHPPGMGYTPGLRAYEQATRKRGVPGALLLHTEDQIAELRTKLKYATSDRREKLERSLDIKTKFAAKLRGELAGKE